MDDDDLIYEECSFEIGCKCGNCKNLMMVRAALQVIVTDNCPTCNNKGKTYDPNRYNCNRSSCWSCAKGDAVWIWLCFSTRIRFPKDVRRIIAEMVLETNYRVWIFRHGDCRSCYDTAAHSLAASQEVIESDGNDDFLENSVDNLVEPTLDNARGESC